MIPKCLTDLAQRRNSKSQLTQALSLVIEVAEDQKKYFHASLPQSLSAEVNDHESRVALFKREELVLGPMLGSGNFSDVYEVKSFSFDRDSTMKNGDGECRNRLHMKKCEKYRQTDKARYALKHLKKNYLQENGLDAYLDGASDLALETVFLANLDHPNIIKLRGLTSAGAAGFANGPSGYFIIIDRLFETLDQRIDRWRSQTEEAVVTKKGLRQMRTRCVRAFPRFRNKKTTVEEGIEVVDMQGDGGMDECLSAALQVSAAMMYLHSHSIIFRGLKPQNIGFDVRGDVKIFDFGMARIVPEGGNPYDDRFKMSGVGSRRYMAPECLIGENYNLKADVYTFSIVLWEMLSRETPYSFARTKEQLNYHVVEEQGRPDIDDAWPSQIKRMLRASFDGDMDKRPKMIFFHNSIKEALIMLRGGDNTGLTRSHILLRRSDTSITANITDVCGTSAHFPQAPF